MHSSRALSFDSCAEAYDRLRPSYPYALFADLLEIAELPDQAHALEIGCGSGIATVPVARTGVNLVALEPGPRLARIARRRLEAFPDTTVVETTFEDWQPEPNKFHLIYSAQAFHWLDPDTRFERAASALVDMGSLAIFGNVTLGPNADILPDMNAAYARHAPHLLGPSPTSWYLTDGPVPDLIRESGLFDDVRCRSHSWWMRYSAADYLSLLESHSDHALLSNSDRLDLFNSLSGILAAAGGEIDVSYESSVFVARRLANG